MVVSLLHSLFDFLAFKNGMCTFFNRMCSKNCYTSILSINKQSFYDLGVVFRYSVLEQEQVHGRSIGKICDSEFCVSTNCFPVPS